MIDAPQQHLSPRLIYTSASTLLQPTDAGGSCRCIVDTHRGLSIGLPEPPRTVNPHRRVQGCQATGESGLRGGRCRRAIWGCLGMAEVHVRIASIKAYKARVRRW